MFLIM